MTSSLGQGAMAHPGASGSSRRLFISTGDVSGDLQGALLIEALVQRGLDRGLTLDITALGGPRMAQAGATLIGDGATALKHIRAIGNDLQMDQARDLLSDLATQDGVHTHIESICVPCTE